MTDEIENNAVLDKEGPADDAEMFSFDDPEIYDGEFDDFDEIFFHHDNEYYEPAISKKGLAKMRWANGHHGAVGEFKANQAVKYLKPNKMVKRKDLFMMMIDHVYCGDGYMKRIENAFGDTLGLVHQNTLPVRRLKREKKKSPRFGFLKGGELKKFKRDEIIQLSQYDSLQKIYGTPSYFGAINSIILNKEATDFRIRFYKNGNHMGYLFVTTAAALSVKDRKKLAAEIAKSKGVGNFRSMYLHLPDRGKTKIEDLVKIIPVGEIGTKDEYQRIKNISRDEIMAAWRVRPELAGMMPEGNGSTGDMEKISRVNYENEVVPMQNMILDLNEYLPKKHHIKFRDPDFT